MGKIAERDKQEQRRSRFPRGPWVVGQFRREFGLGVWPIYNGSIRVADTYGHCDGGEANARLIAAAPDLLAALKAVVGGEHNPPVGTPGHVDLDEALVMARAAIDKAWGREP